MKVNIDFNGKKVVDIEIDDIDTRDYPDFCDAFISAAWYEDGSELTGEEILKFEDENSGIASELAFEYIT